MAKMTKTFRIFVSSTFSDLKDERNALHKFVFPRLRELCAQYGCRFQAIDLRWGVSEEAGLDQQTMKICLGEIERSQKVSPRPNFIILLGDRYGWRPLPCEVPAVEFEMIENTLTDREEKELLKKWYWLDDNNVPPVYCLQPRTGEYADYQTWEHKAEQPLRIIFQKALEELQLARVTQFNYTASATEQEIVHGALNVEDAPEHVFCFFRSIQGMPGDAGARDYLDYNERLEQPDEDAQKRLKTLKETLKTRLPDNWFEYEASWKGNSPSADHIGSIPASLDKCLELEQPDRQPATLCEDVWRKLSKMILNEIALIEEAEPLLQEISLHDNFREERSKFFVGREKSLQAVSNYLLGNSSAPFAVYGLSGSGKSALMAAAITKAHKHHSNTVIVSRFIGATPVSLDGRSLLESLCQQIACTYKQDRKGVPAEYQELVRDFIKRLNTVTADKPLLIFLDALDQFSYSDQARKLEWLPLNLPPNVKIVISTLPGEGLDILQRRLPHESLMELKPMDPGEGEALLKIWLDDAGRKLQPPQEQKVLGNFQANGLPLYLKLAFEEARGWRSYTKQEETQLSPNIPGIIQDNLFARLSGDVNHGKVMVSKSLGYIAASRYGLSEDEILDILSRDQEVLQDIRGRARHDLPEEKVPVVIWSRLYFDLEPYLSERMADGAVVLNFYHRQLGEAAVQKYLDGNRKQSYHQHLARYFGSPPLWMEKNSQRTPNLRQVSELPFHQTEGCLWPEFKTTLKNLEFIEAKCTAGLTFDLAADYNRALEHGDIPEKARVDLKDYCSFVLSQSHILKDYPELTFQQAANSPDQTMPAKEGKYLLETAFKRRPWLRWLNKPQDRSACLVTIAVNNYPSSCSFSPDGTKLIATGVMDNTVKVWDAINGVKLITLAGPGSVLYCSAFSHDGCKVAAGSDEGKLMIWDLLSGAELLTLAGHSWNVNSCAFSPNGKKLVSCSRDGTVRIWDAESGGELLTMAGHNGSVEWCGFSPGGDLVVSCSEDKTVKIWDAKSGAVVMTLCGHSDWVNCCGFSPDGKKLVSASLDHQIKVWDAASGMELLTMAGHRDWVSSCCFSNDGKKVVSGSWDNTLKIWDAESGTEMKTLSGHRGNVECCGFSPDGSRVVSGSEDDTLKIWDVNGSNVPEIPVGHSGNVRSCNFSPDGSKVATGSSDKSIKIWDAAGGHALKTLNGHSDWVNCCGFSPDGKKLVSASADHTVKIWDAVEGHELVTLTGHTGIVMSCAFSPDGAKVISSSADRTAKVWDADRGIVLMNLGGHRGAVECCAFSPDGSRFVTGSYDKTLRLYDSVSGDLIAVLGFHGYSLKSCGFSPDGLKLVSASLDKTLKIWDAVNGSEQVTLAGHTGMVMSGVFSPAGNWVLSGSIDGTIKIWDSGSGSLLYDFPLETRIESICISPTGNRIAAGSSDGQVKFFSLENITLNPPVITAQTESNGNYSICCPFCMHKQQAAGDALGRDFICASCRNTMKLNPSVIKPSQQACSINEKSRLQAENLTYAEGTGQKLTGENVLPWWKKILGKKQVDPDKK